MSRGLGNRIQATAFFFLRPSRHHEIILGEDVKGCVELDKAFVENPTATFALTVKGDSMIDAGISEGDTMYAFVDCNNFYASCERVTKF